MGGYVLVGDGVGWGPSQGEAPLVVVGDALYYGLFCGKECEGRWRLVNE